MDVQTQIIQAIRLRRKVELNYKGEGYRIVCPHALYISPTGKKLVDAYQISGYSTHADQIPGWRPFDISKITDIRILDDTFEVATGYNPLSDRYSRAIEMI